MKPEHIANLITENVHLNNGLDLLFEEIQTILEQISLIELNNLAARLPQGGRADHATLSEISQLMSEVQAFSNKIEQVYGQKPENADSLIRVFQTLLQQVYDTELKLSPMQIPANQEQLGPYFTQLIRRIMRAAGTLSARTSFQGQKNPAISDFVNELNHRLGQNLK